MAGFLPTTTPERAELIRTYALLFVASADPGLADGPDGNGPVTVMVCSFEEDAAIVRLFGRAPEARTAAVD